MNGNSFRRTEKPKQWKPKPLEQRAGDSFIRTEKKPLVLKTPEELAQELSETDQQRMIRDMIRKLEGQLMSLWIMGAEQDANAKQRRELQGHLPRLVRQYRATFNPVPVIRFIHRTMGLEYRPKDPQVRAFIDQLEKELGGKAS